MTEIVEYSTVPEYLEEDFNNILYVDDEESNLRVFDSVFSRYYNIYTANNGNTAINMLREHNIHMIITDQKMPEMTGTDLLESILEEFPDIIRIILTGFADIQAIIKAINKCSIYKYITKPYENAEMREIIDKGLDIYNMRQKKYDDAGAKLNGNGHVNGHTPKNGVSVDIQSKQIANLEIVAQHMAADLLPSDEEFESYFDFHIQYRLPQETFSGIYHDFVINADDEGNKLFFLTFKTAMNEAGALSYLHTKSKLRQILEHSGNEVDLHELLGELMAIYQEVEVDFAPHDFKIVTYSWETGEFQYLAKEKLIKPYEISQQLLPMSLEQHDTDDNDYTLYSGVSEQELVVYFWDYVLSEKGNTEESPNYFRQIVDNATSMPFDLQAGQISKGVKSVGEHFNDAVLFALYLNE